jgi:hypothetical protein
MEEMQKDCWEQSLPYTSEQSLPESAAVRLATPEALYDVDSIVANPRAYT